MKSVFIVCLAMIGVSLSACKQESPQKQEPSETASPAPLAKPKEEKPAAAGSESIPETKVIDGIPTEEDYEVEAARTITADNLEAELDKLEAEIGAN